MVHTLITYSLVVLLAPSLSSIYWLVTNEFLKTYLTLPDEMKSSVIRDLIFQMTFQKVDLMRVNFHPQARRKILIFPHPPSLKRFLLQENEIFNKPYLHSSTPLSPKEKKDE